VSDKKLIDAPMRKALAFERMIVEAGLMLVIDALLTTWNPDAIKVTVDSVAKQKGIPV
jgi:hypothetical protein